MPVQRVFFQCIWLLAVIAAGFLCSPTSAQRLEVDDHDLLARPVGEIRIIGLERVSEQLVLNQLRTAVGDPYDPQVIRGDVTRLERLGQFRTIEAEVELLADGSVAVIFTLVEQPIIHEIQFVGNRVFPDRDLRAATRLLPGGPRDDFLIQEAVRRIEEKYRERGYYLTSVEVSEPELAEGILIFRIIEGPRVRIRVIDFEGNESFPDRQLRSQIRTRTAIPLIRRGQLDEDQLTEDIAEIIEYYRNRGYLDVRVDRQVELSPDSREAMVTFLVYEGRQYRLRRVIFNRRGPGPGRELEIFAPDQLMELLDIRPGDVYSLDRIRRSVRAVEQAYRTLGYYYPANARAPMVGAQEIRTDEEEPTVDLMLDIHEGTLTTVGLIEIAGNTLTQDKVIRRQLTRIRPGRPLNADDLEEAHRRIRNTRLFNDVRITVLDPEPDAPTGPYEERDILVEVKERNTGAVTFGAAIGSDTGLFGQLALTQDNFDLFDLPESFHELITGKAFRGAGQRFNMSLEPGTRVSTFSLGITEPYFLDTDTSLRVSGFFRDRVFRRYDEDRKNVSLALGRRFGEIWSGSVTTRFERVKLSNIDPIAPVDVFDDSGPDTLTAMGLTLTRSTIGTIERPGRGTRLDLSVEQVGLLGGAHDFTKVGGEYTVFLTLDEDFLGRRTTLRLNTRMAYIFGGRAPTYERYYLGGRSFRGFAFREVSPKGIRADTGEVGVDPVGGDWLFFLGAQYEAPIFQETLTGVLFIDSGTVTDSLGLDDYRVSIGAGIRLYIPQFGPVPIAFDLAVPLRKRPGDRTQLLSFSAELPF